MEQILNVLKRRVCGGLRIEAIETDTTLEVRLENTAFSPRTIAALNLTYAYQRPLVEALFGTTPPRVQLRYFSQGEDPPVHVEAGESLAWSKELGAVASELESTGMKHWPDTRWMRLDDPRSRRLAASGWFGLRIVNLVRELTFWRLVVLVIDENGERRKVKIKTQPPWNRRVAY